MEPIIYSVEFEHGQSTDLVKACVVVEEIWDDLEVHHIYDFVVDTRADSLDSAEYQRNICGFIEHDDFEPDSNVSELAIEAVMKALGNVPGLWDNVYGGI